LTTVYSERMEHKRPLEAISDDELLGRLSDLVCQTRRVEADVVAHIGEVEERGLYAREASPSMFVYCTEVLHLSEAEAYLRIAVARASRAHPMLLTMMGDGRLHLTGAARLAPYLTQENRGELLKRATHRSRRQIEELIAEVAPRPDVPGVIRKLPKRRSKASLQASSPNPARVAPDGLLCPDRVGIVEPGAALDEAAVDQRDLRPDGVEPSPVPNPVPPVVASHVPPAVVQPLSPARYKIQFTASAELRNKLERLRALMRGEAPEGDLAAVIEQAVTEKLERLEARRFARTNNPRKRPSDTPMNIPRKGLSKTDRSSFSRHIPAALRRAVFERDGGRCRYVDRRGRRCSERSRLEYHHRHPFALGGDRSLENIYLMCRRHNGYLAEHDYGRKVMLRYRRSANHASEAVLVDRAWSAVSKNLQARGT
jgi:5-methylcytosine-specific restriction endonuclease McrA